MVIYEAGAVSGEWGSVSTDGWQKVKNTKPAVGQKAGKKFSQQTQQMASSQKISDKLGGISTSNTMANLFAQMDEDNDDNTTKAPKNAPKKETIVTVKKEETRITKSTAKIKCVRYPIGKVGEAVTMKIVDGWLAQAKSVDSMGPASQLDVLATALHVTVIS